MATTTQVAEMVSNLDAAIETFNDETGLAVVIVPLYGQDSAADFDELAATTAKAGFQVLRSRLRGSRRNSTSMSASLHRGDRQTVCLNHRTSARAGTSSVFTSAEYPNSVLTENGLIAWRLRRVQEYVDLHLAHPITLTDLANIAGLSRMHFAAQFRRATGVRPHEFVLRRRVARSQEILLSSDLSLAQIALSHGFETQSHYTAVFKRIVGETPARWRAVASLAPPRVKRSETSHRAAQPCPGCKSAVLNGPSQVPNIGQNLASPAALPAKSSPCHIQHSHAVDAN